MKYTKLLSKLNIQEVKYRKTKNEYKKEVHKIIREFRKYKNDTNYKFFVKDLVVNLCKDVDLTNLNEIIKSLQRMKSAMIEDISSEDII